MIALEGAHASEGPWRSSFLSFKVNLPLQLVCVGSLALQVKILGHYSILMEMNYELSTIFL